MTGPLAIFEGLIAPELAVGHQTKVEHDTPEEHSKAAFIGSAQHGLTDDVHGDVGDESHPDKALPPFLAAPHEQHGEHDKHSECIKHNGSPGH